MTRNITIPTVHMNGTAYKDLFEPARAAMDAIRAADKALIEMTPNGRDYYPQGDSAFTNARQQHEQRRQALRNMLSELEDLAIGIQDQGRR